MFVFPPEETVSWAMFTWTFLAVTKSHFGPSDHISLLLQLQTGACSEMLPPGRTTLILRKIQHQWHHTSQMCWICGDHKDYNVIPQPEGWMNREIRALSRSRKAAFGSGDKEASNSARAELKAKWRHRQRLERELKRPCHCQYGWT